MKLKVINIGNSKGVRLSQTLLQQYQITDELDIELKKDGILLKPVSNTRAGWEVMFKKEMKKSSAEEKKWMQFKNKFDEEEWAW